MKTLIQFALSVAITLAPSISGAAEGAPRFVPLAGQPARDAEARPRELRDSAAYSAVRGQELMVNGFRAPSIGLEYRVGLISVHAGAYPTIVNEGETAADGTTWFAKTGISLWFLPVPMFGNERSSFYSGVAYVNDFGGDWGQGAQLEAGFRLVFLKGLFARLGASALYAPDRSCPTDDCQKLKVRPNPAIGWGFAID